MKGAPKRRGGASLATLFRDGSVADVEKVRDMPSLPDSANELRALAKALDAGPGSVLLRDQATERG